MKTQALRGEALGALLSRGGEKAASGEAGGHQETADKFDSIVISSPLPCESFLETIDRLKALLSEGGKLQIAVCDDGKLDVLLGSILMKFSDVSVEVADIAPCPRPHSHYLIRARL